MSREINRFCKVIGKPIVEECEGCLMLDPSFAHYTRRMEEIIITVGNTARIPDRYKDYYLLSIWQYCPYIDSSDDFTFIDVKLFFQCTGQLRDLVAMMLEEQIIRNFSHGDTYFFIRAPYNEDLSEYEREHIEEIIGK